MSDVTHDLARLLNSGFRVVMCLTLVLASSCVTTRKARERVAIPVVFQPLFRACSPNDQEALLTVTKADARIFAANVVWSIPSEARAEIQFNTPIGDTLFEARRVGVNWAVTGESGLQIEERDDGRLSINGHEIPVKSGELGCILTGVWPADWLASLEISERGPASIHLGGDDRSRRIDVDISLRAGTGDFQSGDIKSCAMLKWGGLLGFFRNAVTVCRDQAKDVVSMRLTGVNSYILDWTIRDDS